MMIEANEQENWQRFKDDAERSILNELKGRGSREETLSVLDSHFLSGTIDGNIFVYFWNSMSNSAMHHEGLCAFLDVLRNTPPLRLESELYEHMSEHYYLKTPESV